MRARSVRDIPVTALYEIVPAGQKVENPGVDELKYSKIEPSDTRFNNELMTVKLRYKEPKDSESKLLKIGVLDKNNSIENASDNLKFASAWLNSVCFCEIRVIKEMQVLTIF